MKDMSKTLHQKYPDYQRLKYKVFYDICEAGLDYLQKSAAAKAKQDTAAKTVTTSDSRLPFCHLIFFLYFFVLDVHIGFCWLKTKLWSFILITLLWSIGQFFSSCGFFEIGYPECLKKCTLPHMLVGWGVKFAKSHRAKLVECEP